MKITQVALPVYFLYCLTTTLSVSAQQYLEINYAKLPVNNKVKQTYPYKTHVRIKIINVNRFLYNINESRADSEYNTNMPAILSTLALPPVVANKTENPSNYMQTIRALDLSSNDPANLQDLILGHIKDIRTTESLINSMVVTHNDCVDIGRSCDMLAADICSAVQTRISQEVAKLGHPSGTIIAMTTAWEKAANDAIANANKSFEHAQELYAKWKNASLKNKQVAIAGKTTTLVEAKFQLDQMADALKGVKNPTRRKEAQKAILEKQEDISEKQTDIDNSNETFQNMQKQEDDLVAQAKAMVDDINGYKAGGKIYSLGDDLKKINLSNYTYYSELITTKKDVMMFKFALTSNGLSICDKPNEDQIEVKLKTKGGLKVDFSTGIFINWGSQNFYGNTFYNKPVTDSMSVIASPNMKTRALLSVGALAHFYRRSPYHVKLGGSIGASLSTGETLINLHIGPSLIIGNENRFILTAGLTLRQETLLDPNYNTTTTYSTTLLPATVPTITTFPAVGYFVALTYNLSSL